MDTEGVLLRFDGLFRRVQEEMEEDKETIETVNSLMVVAAFIAGVQAQIISFTLNLPLSALPRAANFFAFVGLMLEIIGTFLGAIHSVYLQRKVKGFNRTVNNMIQCKVDLKITLKLYVDALEIEERRRRRKIKALENKERKMGDEKARNDPDQTDIFHETLDLPGENGFSDQNNDVSTEEDEEVLGQEPEDLSSQNPEDIPRQHQKFNTYYSGMVSGHNFVISGGTFNNLNNVLDRSITENIEDQKERFERLQSTMQEIRRLSNSQLGVIGLIENILEKAGNKLKLNVQGVHNPPDSARDSPPPGQLARVPTQPFNVSALGPGPYNAEPTPPIFKFGNIPVLSMASGVVCLAFSTILLSAATKDLGPEVWISSTLVLAMVATLSVFPFRSWVLDQIKIHWTDVAGRRQTMPR